jgi:glycerol uptake facilitator-like aquaporin
MHSEGRNLCLIHLSCFRSIVPLQSNVQMVGAICGAGMIHAINTTLYDKTNGGCNFVQPGYSNGKCGARASSFHMLFYF